MKKIYPELTIQQGTVVTFRFRFINQLLHLLTERPRLGVTRVYGFYKVWPFGYWVELGGVGGGGVDADNFRSNLVAWGFDCPSIILFVEN